MAKGCASFLSGQSHQLTRSLERILEDAHVSGELKLSGRKLKDFPKTGGKYDLSDTVTAVTKPFKIVEFCSQGSFNMDIVLCIRHCESNACHRKAEIAGSK
ncbi:Leucine-rich repeat and calponin homology domain-containing protein [Frankliniella fusca]|uniref:Leucine-rich repeat and calponin homology domain-containing protein n=1 Tax=Frankliniella fusca TaxID=407009 RepID=A0AAE1GTE8_9NEOP|nr:Leucine-rich repeat and calponin homology domain-containing protein [Frankliniella fusca]